MLCAHVCAWLVEGMSPGSRSMVFCPHRAPHILCASHASCQTFTQGGGMTTTGANPCSLFSGVDGRIDGRWVDLSGWGYWWAEAGKDD
jgi:hypothetical protein